MTRSQTNPKVDAYIAKAKTWRDETIKLRQIILETELTEELKWGKPCYTLEGKNVLIIIGLKDDCALMFVNGALLKDANRLLSQPGDHTQAGRWIKFRSVAQITQLEPVLTNYIHEAISAQKAGLKVTYKKTADFKVPAELKSKFAQLPAFKNAFHSLTPGRQRGYLIYFAAAKQAKTRVARIEKCLPQILDGKGLND